MYAKMSVCVRSLCVHVNFLFAPVSLHLLCSLYFTLCYHSFSVGNNAISRHFKAHLHCINICENWPHNASSFHFAFRMRRKSVAGSTSKYSNSTFNQVHFNIAMNRYCKLKTVIFRMIEIFPTRGTCFPVRCFGIMWLSISYFN